MKNYAYYEVDTIESIKDMIANSVKKYGDKDAMLIKKKTGEPCLWQRKKISYIFALRA